MCTMTHFTIRPKSVKIAPERRGKLVIFMEFLAKLVQKPHCFAQEGAKPAKTGQNA